MPVGMLQLDDVGVGDVVEILDERSQAVAVRGDEHAPAGPDGGAIGAVPVRQEPRHGVLERLGQGQFAWRQRGVTWIARSDGAHLRVRAAAAGCRSSGARSSPAPRRAWRRSRPCSIPAARRSGARSAASLSRPESTSGPVRRAPDPSVRMARFSTDVKATSKCVPPSFSRRPLRALPRRPCSDRSTSVHPVNRFSLFQVLSPCRSRTSLCIVESTQRSRIALRARERCLCPEFFLDAHQLVVLADPIGAAC